MMMMMMRTMKMMMMMSKPHHRIPSLGLNDDEDEDGNKESYNDDEKVSP